MSCFHVYVVFIFVQIPTPDSFERMEDETWPSFIKRVQQWSLDCWVKELEIPLSSWKTLMQAGMGQTGARAPNGMGILTTQPSGS